MKKALSIILSLVMVIGLIPMAALPAFAEGEATVAENPVINVYDKVIPATDSTGVTFASLIGKTLAANTTYKLMEDIDLSSVSLTGESNINLAGGDVIDGQGHSITGIAFKSKVNAWCQIFNANAASGTNTFTIKNINFGSIESPITYVPLGNEAQNGNVNGLFGLIKGTNDASTLNLENLSAYVNTNFTATQWCANGVFVNKTWGYVNFTNCTVDGSLAANGYTGAFIGVVADRVTTFTDCVNNANVSNTGTDGAGGFIGRVQQNAGATFTSCVNNGDINGSRFTGGFIGIFEGSKKLSVTSCVNNGKITNSKNDKTHCGVGGFLGSMTTSPDVSITNFVNKGQVQGYIASGGIVGFFGGKNIEINSCVNAGNIACAGRSGGAIGAINPGTVATVDTFFNKGNVSCEWTHAGSVLGAVASGKEAPTDIYNVTMNNVLNIGTIKAGEPAGFSGYLAYSTLTINNCINVGKLVPNASSDPRAFCACEASNGIVTTIISDSTEGNINNMYLNTAKYKFGLLGANQSKSATLDEIITALNANTQMVSAFGRFTSNAAGDSVTVATPELQGYQMSAIDKDNKYNIRFIATINDVKLADPCEYAYLGMEFSFDGGETYIYNKSISYVYKSIIATDSGNQITYTAEELGGEYIYAVIADNIDATKALNVVVRTFAEDQSGNRYYGKARTVAIPAMVTSN